MFQEKRKTHFSYLIMFLWMSLSAHLYIFYGLNLFSQLDYLNAMQDKQKITQVKNIILNTKTDAERLEEDAVISDKNNINSGTEFDKNKEEIYNILNPKIAQNHGQGGETSFIKQVASPDPVQQKSPITDTRDKGRVVIQKQTQQASDGGGAVAPTLFDPKEQPVVNLYNRGQISLATQSKEYADYFLAMQSKIEKFHKEFFPVYQYYQGLINDGTVIVEFVIDQKGDIVGAEVVQSIGSATVDKASLNAVVYAESFGDVPEELSSVGNIKIRFHFLYVSR